MARAGVVMAVLVALAGCGGGDEHEATDTPSAKERYIARADALCRETNERLAPVRTEIAQVDNGKRSADEVFREYARLTGRAGSIADRFLARFEQIPPPPEDRAEIVRLTQLIDRQVALLQDEATAALDRDAARIKALSARLSKASAAYRSAARSYGFEVCGATA